MEYLVAIFRSRTETMGFYRFLLSNGVPAEIINTPKEANVGCGLSVKVSKAYYGVLKRALSGFNPKSLVGIFLVKADKDKKIVRPV